MIRRRIVVAIVYGLGIIIHLSVGALLFDDYHLSIRNEILHELNSISNHGEFAPHAPTPSHRAMIEKDPNEQQSRKSCTSPLINWTNKQIRTMGYDTYKDLYDNKIIQMAYIYTQYISKSSSESSYFVNNEQTRELLKRHHDTIHFWKAADIDNTILGTSSIQLLSMSGSILSDNTKLIPTIMHMFNFHDNMDDVLNFANKVQSIVQDLPNGYDNPLLTMNAIATRSNDDKTRNNVRGKDSIIIGDGVFQFLYDEGLESSGPDFVHAHEFGHHLQFQIDLSVPHGHTYNNDDRRKELMADAISAYFLTHNDGGNMFIHEIGIFDKTAFSTGDCSVNEDDHHGTPKQRQCAAIWGASLSSLNLEHNTVPVLDPEVFVMKFNNAYSDMLALDAKVCTLVFEEEEWIDADYQDEHYQDLLDSKEKEHWWSPFDAAPEEEQTKQNQPIPYNPLPQSATSVKNEQQDKGDKSTNPYGILIVPPKEKKESYMKNDNGLTVDDCDQPFVYCSTGIVRRKYIFGPLCYVSALAGLLLYF